jgi:hypothetical protein
VIIDCHGHCTTAPAALWDWRKKQVAGQDPGPLRIPDDEIRDALEKNQLRIQRERGRPREDLRGQPQPRGPVLRAPSAAGLTTLIGRPAA